MLAVASETVGKTQRMKAWTALCFKRPPLHQVKTETVERPIQLLSTVPFPLCRCGSKCFPNHICALWCFFKGHSVTKPKRNK